MVKRKPAIKSDELIKRTARFTRVEADPGPSSKVWTAGEIRDFRKRLDLTQESFAVMLRISRTHVSYLEKEARKPSDTLRALLDCLERDHKNRKGGLK